MHNTFFIKNHYDIQVGKNKNDLNQVYEKSLALVWMLLGAFLIYWGINNYIEYSRDGRLWLYIIPESSAVKNIFLGLLSCFIGIAVGIKSNSKFQLLLLFSLLIVSIPIWNTIYYFFKFRQFEMGYLINFDFVFLILVALSFNILKDDNSSITTTASKLFTEHKTMLIVSGIVIPILITLIAEFFPYESIGFIHE